MPDQPLPTPDELVQWLREEAAKSRLAAELSGGLPGLGNRAEWAKDAAWHEAAASMLDALAAPPAEELR